VIKILNNNVTECHPSKVLGTISGDTIAHMYQKITKKLSGQNWKSHPSMVLGILSQIYLEKISAVCLCTPYKLRVHPRNQKPRIKIAESSRKKVDSWFLVSMDVRVYTGRWLSECFWPMCRCVICVFSRCWNYRCSWIFLFVFLSFSEFSRSLQYCSLMRCVFCLGFVMVLFL